MSASTVDESRSVLHLSPAERAERDIEPSAVRDALLDVARHGSREQKVLAGCALPAIDLAYRDVEGANTHPLVFRDCEIESLSAEHADVRLPVHVEESTLGACTLDGARFAYDVAVTDSTVEGGFEADETRFDLDVDCAGTTFEAPVRADEARFGDDTRFDDARFEARASFQAAEFYGVSNLLDDNASFTGATFAGEATFEQAQFGHATFEDASFEAAARFQETVFDGDVDLAGVAFADEADFDECHVDGDVTFEGARFDKVAAFSGAHFEGGARALHDDVRFVDCVFAADARFEHAALRYSNFAGCTFEGDARFDEAEFTADADFDGAEFTAVAGFDEARFREDASFADCTFRGPARFHGAVFEGDARHLEDNATFEGATFESVADFDAASFTSANFVDTRFAGDVDLSGVTFDDRLDMLAVAEGNPYVDLTDATVPGGTITQPEAGWVRYDMTHASIGDVALAATHESDRRDLLDYFRFCETVFDEFDGDEFDFSAHTDYLDRNRWELHVFDDPVDREYAQAMTPEVTESTYLKAKRSASAAGDMKAAGEFRVKRQAFARKKHLAIAADGAATLGERVRNGIRAVENGFLGVTCGHGMRLFRIFVVFLVAPIIPGLLYTYGGPAFRTNVGQPAVGEFLTTAGLEMLFTNVYFSYITYLTIGYGNNAPVGPLARVLAASEVYLSVLLGGLVLYALIKRSEI